MTAVNYSPDCRLRPHQLTVLTTSECNARCAHCLVRAGPERHDALGFNEMVRSVEAASAASPISVVVFAGGEPTLLGETLLDAVAHVSCMGIATRLVTNAWWATTPESARDMVVRLREAGLDELNVSADDFHLPFLSLDHVANAWRASKGAGFASVVIALCSGPTSKVTPETVMDAIGERVPLIFDEEGQAQALAPPTSDGTRYVIANNLIYRIGRGRNLRDRYVQAPDSQESLNRPCPWAVRSAALSPKNHFVACCGIEAEGNEVLDFGALADFSVPDLVAKANQDPLVAAIAELGPQYLMRRALEADPALQFRPQYTAICEICEDVTSNPHAVAALRRQARRLRTDVAVARVASFLATDGEDANTGQGEAVGESTDAVGQ